LVYASYLPKKTNIVLSSLSIAFFDSLMAFCACFMIFPIIIQSDIEISESMAILFTSISTQIQLLPFGNFFVSLFFLLLAFAGLTSAISLMEAVVSQVSYKFSWTRSKSTLFAFFLSWPIGILCAFGNIPEANFFDFTELLDFLTTNITLPMGAFIITLFVAYRVKSEELKNSLMGFFGGKTLFNLWKNYLKWVAPFIIFIVASIQFFS